MSLLSLALPGLNEFLNTAAPENNNAFTAIQNWANGNVDSVNLAAGGVNPDRLAKGITFTGVANISATESRTNTAYGTLTTPDQVTGVVLPANGLIAVWYQATWQESVAAAARAAFFIGSNQLKVADTGASSPVTQAAATNSGGAASDLTLTTAGYGLVSATAQGGYSGDVTTGQALGFVAENGVHGGTELNGTVRQADATTAGAVHGLNGPCCIKAAAGTYTISVQFKSTSGSVTAKNRTLVVAALSF